VKHWVLAICVLAGGCTQFPELDALETPGIADADYPALLPISELLTTEAPRAVPELRDAIQGRVAALRARAQRLSGPVLDAPTRRRLSKEITLPQ
jgi:hypothetical protein